MKKAITNSMNEWGIIGQERLVGIGKSATSARPEALI